MRTWLEVFNPSGVKVAVIESQVSATTNEKLDSSGTFDLSCVVDEKVVDYLVRDNEVAIWGQEDSEPPQRWMYGVIIKPQVTETGASINIKISGRDLMEELRRVTVGLGRTYNAQSVQTIMSDLLSGVSGWIAGVETAFQNQLQTARFDGTTVLKAALKSAGQLGLHIRNSTSARVLEIGAFGAAAVTGTGEKIRAIKPPSNISRELYDNDAVLLVDSISMTEDGDSLVNWAIPMGAGEGSAATTLKYTTYQILNTDNTIYQAGSLSDFPIYRRVNAANIEEFYIDASEGAAQHQDTLSFKEIGPIANSTLAKQYAANALANACIEHLKRSRQPLIGYTLRVLKVRSSLRVGDVIHLTYRGIVPTGGPKATRKELVYIDVDQDLWVMGIQRSISEGDISTTLQVNTIDQKIKDDTDILVEVLDKTQVENLAIKTRTTSYEKTYYDKTGNNGSGYRPATFRFRAKNTVVDVVSVFFSFKTMPLDATTASILLPGPIYELWWQETDGYNYPSDVSIWINGVDVTSELAPGGLQWNDGGVNAALDVEDLDITQYIIDNGIHNETVVEIKCESRTGEVRFNSGYPSLIQSTASNGIVEATFNITTNVRDIVPTE